MWHVLSNKPINIPSSVECDEGLFSFVVIHPEFLCVHVYVLCGWQWRERCKTLWVSLNHYGNQVMNLFSIVCLLSVTVILIPDSTVCHLGP